MKNFTEIIERRERVTSDAKNVIELIEGLNKTMQEAIEEGSYLFIQKLATRAHNAKLKLAIMLEQNLDYDEADKIFKAQKEQAA
jgi:hypothetical protein